MKKKTVVFGASVNSDRYSNRAIRMLRKNDHPVVAIGLREGMVEDVLIVSGHPPLKDVDSITLYLSAKNQVPLYEYILSLNPRRIIYNPGAENPELTKLAEKKGIENLEACTLVLLSTGQY